MSINTWAFWAHIFSHIFEIAANALGTDINDVKSKLMNEPCITSKETDKVLEQINKALKDD